MVSPELSPEEQAQDDFEQHAINYTGRKYSLYHVSPKHNREDIESSGVLLARDPHPEQIDHTWGKPGVWHSYSPETNYGDDIYGIENLKGEHDTETDSTGYGFTPHDIPNSDFKRVGHVHFKPNGHTEVHWHLEEHCPQLQPKLFEDK
jgi:hypothetical protein